jgi:hypothetical protein
LLHLLSTLGLLLAACASKFFWDTARCRRSRGGVVDGVHDAQIAGGRLQFDGQTRASHQNFPLTELVAAANRPGVREDGASVS